MNTLERLLSHYEAGRLTATGLILESLQLINDENVDAVLESLPPEVVETLNSFVGNFHSETQVFRGPKPTEESVQIARAWLSEHSLLKARM